MAEATVSVEQQGHILLIGLNRPEKRNAINVDTFHQLAEAYTRLDRDPELRCGVLFAHGDHFTGGIDLPEWTPYFQNGNALQPQSDMIDPMGINGKRLSKPMVMAVQGWCLTIGIEMLLACDIRIASRDTRFAQIEIKRGIYPVGGATLRFMMEVGWGNAMRYLLTGDEFSADEAYRMGLVQEVVNKGEQVLRAVEIAETIAKQAPLGVMATLRSSRHIMNALEADAKEKLLPELLPLMESEDVQEGLQSFIERREAQFKGK